MQFSIKLLLLLIFCSIYNISAKGLNTETISSGELVKLKWKGLPVYVYKRSHSETSLLGGQKEVLSSEELLNGALTNLAKASGNRLASSLFFGTKELDSIPTRSIKEDVLVVVGISSFFGCMINKKPKEEYFIDHCSGAEYGLDGRIKSPNSKERYHLLIPPHYYKNDMLYLGIEKGIEIEQIDFTPDILSLDMPNGQKLVEALQWRQVKVVNQLLKKTDVIDYVTDNGSTALYSAASGSNINTLKTMIELGFNINHINKNGVTPLHMALLTFNKSNISFLIKSGAKTEKFCIENRCAKNYEQFLSEYRTHLSIEEIRSFIEEVKDDL